MVALKTASQSIQDDPGRAKLVLGHIYRLNRAGPLGEILVRLERLDVHDKAVVLLNLFGVERAVHVLQRDLEEQ